MFTIFQKLEIVIQKASCTTSFIIMHGESRKNLMQLETVMEPWKPFLKPKINLTNQTDMPQVMHMHLIRVFLWTLFLYLSLDIYYVGYIFVFLVLFIIR